MKILAIDPGNIDSGYVLTNDLNIIESGKIRNENLLKLIYNELSKNYIHVVIEMVASYGMPVGKEVFNTCVWIGRFVQACIFYGQNSPDFIFRKEVKMNLCNSNRAKDSNVIQALIDRFANTNLHGKYGKGTKNNRGYFYGFSKDIWQAYAVAVTYYDKITLNI